MTTSDVYSRITEEIIKKMEQGAGDFKLPWYKTKDSTLISPVNAKTGNNYKGINILSLWMSGMSEGYSRGIWATYKQWSELGAQVRKGEKGSLIAFYKILDVVGKGQPQSDEPTESTKSATIKHRMYAQMSYVFNADQVDGYTPPPEPSFNPDSRIAEVEKFFASLDAIVEHGGNKAFYSPSLDKIQMPYFGAFRDKESYYSVLAHEVTHWTGHTSRCNRDFSGRFGSSSYAAEELVAELGAAFLCSLLKITNEPRQDHANYISDWISILKKDKKAIFTASSKAQEAVDWLEKQSAINLSNNQKAA